MTNIEHTFKKEQIRPPVVSVGVIGWIKANLFNGWFNSALTIVTLFFMWKTVPPLFRWAFLDRTGVSRCRRCLLVDYFIEFSVYPVRFLSLRFAVAAPFGHDDPLCPSLFQPES
jgi:hypothetical protein